jgi:hypothetical protein
MHASDDYLWTNPSALSTPKATLQDNGTLDHGDFVDSDFVEAMEIQDNTENPEWDQLGFYYPLRIGSACSQMPYRA